MKRIKSYLDEKTLDEVIVHGYHCSKIPHVGDGHLHEANDDMPFIVDRCWYCGRCHISLGNPELDILRRKTI